jgi:hypothetical protein
MFITTRTKEETRADPGISCNPPNDVNCIIDPNSPTLNTSRYYIADIEDYTVYFEHVVYGLTNDFFKKNSDMKGEVYIDSKKQYELPEVSYLFMSNPIDELRQ